MPGTEACWGCGALVPAADGPTHRYIGASAGCWGIYNELLARDYDGAGLPAEHRLCPDTYAAQHPGVESLQALRSVATHLVVLHLVLERDLPVGRMTEAAQRVAKHPGFRWLEPPDQPGAVTVLALHEAREPAEHAARAWDWARAVWDAWRAHHAQVRVWAQETWG